MVLRKHFFFLFLKQWINFLFHWPVLLIFYLMLHLKSSESPKTAFSSSYIQRQGPRGKKAQAPGCFQVGQWQTFLCKPVSVFNWNAIKLSILKLFSMASVAEIHSSLIHITPWGCGVGITQVPAKLLIQPETGLLAQFNSKEMSKTVVSVLALPQGELGWMWMEAHDKGELSCIKKLSCSYLYERSMSCFQESRDAHIPYLIQTRPIPHAQLHGKHKNLLLGLPWWPSGWDSSLPMQGSWVWSLDGELRSHMLQGVAKKPQKTKQNKVSQITSCFKKKSSV